MSSLKLITISFIVMVCFSGNAIAAPSITSTSGVFQDGETVTISGSLFGSNALDIEEKISTINNGTAGNDFLPQTGWSNVGDGADKDFVYATDYSHSGGQSIKADIGAVLSKATLFYDTGEDISSIYATWWVRINTPNPSGQWKMFRVRHDEDTVDTTPEIVMTQFPVEGTSLVAANRPFGGTDYSSEWYETDVQTGRVASSLDYPNVEEWVRMEIWLEASTVATYDGVFDYHIHRPDSEIRDVVIDDEQDLDAVMNYDTGVTEKLRYLLWQNRQTNGMDNLIVWLDDIFIQDGTPARVEIGDNAVFENCTFREIQVPTSWGAGSLAINVNQGSFSGSDTAYLFVVDSSGVASAGYEITIGSTTPSFQATGHTVFNGHVEVTTGGV